MDLLANSVVYVNSDGTLTPVLNLGPNSFGDWGDYDLGKKTTFEKLLY